MKNIDYLQLASCVRYCNGRVMKFSTSGDFLMQWGRTAATFQESKSPPQNVFNIPHSITDVPSQEMVRFNKKNRFGI